MAKRSEATKQAQFNLRQRNMKADEEIKNLLGLSAKAGSEMRQAFKLGGAEQLKGLLEQWAAKL